MSVIVGVDIAKSKFDYRIITEGNDRLAGFFGYGLKALMFSAPIP